MNIQVFMNKPLSFFSFRFSFYMYLITIRAQKQVNMICYDYGNLGEAGPRAALLSVSETPELPIEL